VLQNVLCFVFFSVSITSGFIGWMTYIVILIIQNHTELFGFNNVEQSSRLIRTVFIFFALFVAAFLFSKY